MVDPVHPEPERRFQAKDIPDLGFLSLVEQMMREKADSGGFRYGTGRYDGSPWIMWGEICAAMPDVPAKVVLAKANQLIKRKLLDGCGCGCRGDFHVTERGGEWMRMNPQ